MKIKKSIPITERQLLIILDKESTYTKNLAIQCLEKYGNPNIELGFVMKSSIPITRKGKCIASIRNELSRIRVCLQALIHQK